jgi:uncharacterized protein (TIGR02099 family)
VVVWLRYAVLPNIDDYNGDIAASIASATGMVVTIRDLDAGWQGLRPQLALTGLRITDRRGKAALELERAEVTVSWWTLIAGDLRLNDVDLYRPALALRRGADGLIYLADKPLNVTRAGEEGALAQWLLDQPRLRIHDATLTWRDELARAPEVALTSVEISMRKSGLRHRAALTAIPPPSIAGKLDLRADVEVARRADRWELSGQLFAESDHADLAKLRAHLPLPESLRRGDGSLRLWVDLEPGSVKEVTADLNMRNVRAQLASDALPLDLASIAGRAVYRTKENGFYFGTQGLRFVTGSGVVAQAAEFSVSLGQAPGQPVEGEVRAHDIDLKIAATLVDYFPLPRDLKRQVLAFAPRGRLLESSLHWTGELPAGVRSWRVKSRFEEIAVNAVDAFPGATGMSGSIEGSDTAGTLRLASKGATFEQGALFRAPFAFDALEASASWKRLAQGVEVKIDEAHLANADFEARLSGLYRTLPGSAENSPGWVDITGRIDRANLAATPGYLPNAIAQTRDWLDRAIAAGVASGARFELRGDLWHFPFGDGTKGRFFVESAIAEGKLQYDPQWPAVERVRGDLRFENARLEIHAAEAFIYSSRLSRTTATIANLGGKPPVLELDGQAEIAGADGFRFMRETPLVNGPGAFTRAVMVEGPARVQLKLSYPLWGSEPLRITGEYAFSGANASVGRNLLFNGIRGKLSFTEKAVRAPELTGSLFGSPAVLRIATQPDRTVLTTIEGRMNSPVIGAFIPEAFVRRMAGGADWQARIISGAEDSELRIESNLKGLAIGLPEPFMKAADEARALAVAIRHLGTDREEALASLDGNVYARVTRRPVDGAERWSAALKFGAPVSGEPLREGLWLYGELGRFDLDAWQAALAAPALAPAAAAAPALELRGLELKLGRLRYTGRDFVDMDARMQREGADWRGTLSSPAIAGEVTWNPAGRGRIAARLDRFVLLQEAGQPAGPEPAQSPEDLPALDVVAEKFDFRGRWLGRLEIVAQPDGEDWRIDRLRISNGHASLGSSGWWRKVATGSITTLDLNVETSNLNALLAQFGFGDYVKRGEAKLEGSLVWPGYPYEFAIGALSGRFKVAANKGQFAKIEPGAGKLLGLLSLQSIPRRVTFDFRDIFSDGFAFDRIAGEVKVARGTLLTSDFEVVGPSAFVSMAGEVSLPQETQHLTMRVVPEVGEGVALAATFLGTPVLGLSTLLVQKLLQNPLGKVVAYEYLVTGTWDNPSVTRLGAPATRDGAPSAAAPKS